MDDSHRILDSIRRIVRLLRLSDRASHARLGITTAQLFVLHELGKYPNLSLNELAEKTATDQSSVSVVVARLVERGLVQRERAEDDARRLVLNLSKAGKAAMQKAPPVAQQLLFDAAAQLSNDERKLFADQLAFVVQAMGADGGNVPMLFEEETAQVDKQEGPELLLEKEEGKHPS